jgi:hypothetical protein
VQLLLVFVELVACETAKNIGIISDLQQDAAVHYNFFVCLKCYGTLNNLIF